MQKRIQLVQPDSLLQTPGSHSYRVGRLTYLSSSSTLFGPPFPSLNLVVLGSGRQLHVCHSNTAPKALGNFKVGHAHLVSVESLHGLEG